MLNLFGFEVFFGDFLVLDGVVDYLCYLFLLLNLEFKKLRWFFFKRGVGKDKYKYIFDLENCLFFVKIINFRGYDFYSLKDKIWDEVVEIYYKFLNN